MNINFTKLCEIANANGQSETAEKYRGLMASMKEGSIKKYAVLGEPNSGKSTVINAISGEKSAPVSLLSGRHDSILTVECKDRDYELVEIASERYMGESVKPWDNPLWTADAVIYVVSALTPFTKSDIDALKACVMKGIPFAAVLNKLELVDEDDREATLGYVKDQLNATFGAENANVYEVKNPAKCAESVMREVCAFEDCLDMKEAALTVELGKELRLSVGAAYDKAKEAYEAVKKPEEDQSLQELYWEELAMEIDRRRVRLINDIDGSVYKMYNTCNSILSKKMLQSSDPSYWWRSSLHREMDCESRKISQAIENIVEERAQSDKKWLSESVSEKFGVNLNMDDINAQVSGNDASPADINRRMASAEEGKKKARNSLLISAAVLAGGVFLPLSAIPTVIACTVGSVAVLGTGFWTYVESANEKEEKNRILKGELDKYVSQCRDSAMESVRNYIKYYYDNMIISAKDAQLLKMSREDIPSEEESRALEGMQRLAEDKKRIEEMLSQMLLTEDEDNE